MTNACINSIFWFSVIGIETSLWPSLAVSVCRSVCHNFLKGANATVVVFLPVDYFLFLRLLQRRRLQHRTPGGSQRWAPPPSQSTPNPWPGRNFFTCFTHNIFFIHNRVFKFLDILFHTFWKWTFPMNVCLSVAWLVCHYFRKAQEFTLPCSYRSTRFIYFLFSSTECLYNGYEMNACAEGQEDGCIVSPITTWRSRR